MKLERYAELLEAQRSGPEDEPLWSVLRSIVRENRAFIAALAGFALALVGLWFVFLVAVGQLASAMGPTP
jgi:hypothetical protein